MHDLAQCQRHDDPKDGYGALDAVNKITRLGTLSVALLLAWGAAGCHGIQTSPVQLAMTTPLVVDDSCCTSIDQLLCGGTIHGN